VKPDHTQTLKQACNALEAMNRGNVTQQAKIARDAIQRLTSSPIRCHVADKLCRKFLETLEYLELNYRMGTAKFIREPRQQHCLRLLISITAS